jgi:uncharacterized protein YndB with AHSA1/START domain
MQAEQATCGKGLAAHAALPEQLGALLSAMGQLLENHTRSLPIENANAMLEREAYDRLIKDQHVVATSLKELAAVMRSYRGLPIAPHDASVLADQRSLHVFDSFIQAEEDVLALLQRSVDEHHAMRMTSHQQKESPAARTAMLIRRPVAEVFQAFIDPAITTRFWFTRSTGPLEAGKQVEWIWEMYDKSTRVVVKTLEPNKRIVIEWDGYSDRTLVDWKFAPQRDDSTFVSMTESGWTGSADDLLKYVANSTQGFTWTLAGLKALLEHDIQLNLVADRFPQGVDESVDESVDEP